MPAANHRYRASLTWNGTTAVGHERYDRNHRVSSGLGGGGLALSGDAAFGGDPDVANPEQLLLVAASSCQLLSFLAVAARARIDVVGYRDDAEAVMPEDDLPMRITEIRLRPQIVVRGDASDDRLTHLVAVAHRECFIANSLRSSIVVEPSFERSGAGPR